jgi:hypothetical protein
MRRLVLKYPDGYAGFQEEEEISSGRKRCRCYEGPILSLILSL